MKQKTIEIMFYKIHSNKLDMVVYTCTHSTQELMQEKSFMLPWAT
jgi:hypothetical protein